MADQGTRSFKQRSAPRQWSRSAKCRRWPRRSRSRHVRRQDANSASALAADASASGRHAPFPRHAGIRHHRRQASAEVERIQARFQMSGGRIEWLSLTDANAPRSSRTRWAPTPPSSGRLSRTRRSPSTKGPRQRARRLGFADDKGQLEELPARHVEGPRYLRGCKACFPGYALVTLSTEEALDGGTLTSEPLDAVDDPITEAQTEQVHARRQKWTPTSKVLRLLPRSKRSPICASGFCQRYRSAEPQAQGQASRRRREMIEQGSPEWFAARVGKLTASRMADAMAKIKTGYSANRR